MVISLINTTFRHVPMIYLTFKVLFVKLCSLMLCLDLSVPEDVPLCSRVLSSLPFLENQPIPQGFSSILSKPCGKGIKHSEEVA